MRTGKLATIIYVRDFNAKGHEIAGYIDYAHRLRTTDFEAVFDGKKTIMPTPRDLSYFNWQTMNSAVTSSENWTVLTDDGAACSSNTRATGRLSTSTPTPSPGTTPRASTLRRTSTTTSCCTTTSRDGGSEKKKKKKTRVVIR